MSAEQFLTREARAECITLIASEFFEPEFLDGGGVVTLDRYEQLAHRLGKLVHLFFETHHSALNLAAAYDPAQERPRWEFSQAFCGRDFFFGLQSLTEAELVAMAGQAAAETNSGG